MWVQFSVQMSAHTFSSSAPPRCLCSACILRACVMKGRGWKRRRAIERAREGVWCARLQEKASHSGGSDQKSSDGGRRLIASSIPRSIATHTGTRTAHLCVWLQRVRREPPAVTMRPGARSPSPPPPPLGAAPRLLLAALLAVVVVAAANAAAAAREDAVHRGESHCLAKGSRPLEGRGVGANIHLDLHCSGVQPCSVWISFACPAV